TVLRVVGNVQYALPDPDGQPGEFQPVREGDRLPAGAIIQTRLRSKVMLAFGPDTVVLIDRVTMASIDQFHRTGDTKKVQLGLGHGLISAAAVEGTLRSDMTISSPVATLSKRGTMDFGMRYEPGTGRYIVFLNEEGLVELIDWLRDAQRTLEPGQYVTQALLRWIEMRTLDRYVPINDPWGMTVAEFRWNAWYGSQGLGVVEPGLGAYTFRADYSPSNRPPPRPTQILSVPPVFLPPAPGGPLQVGRPEGNFGTGFGQ
ncbi:MAG TPA: hypothetical protein PLS23_15950, partial [Phycisphaerae bacterium]|nr:hypothetical protein [Phycisphaerae bacterium]